MDDLGEFLFIVLSILIDRILPKRFHAWLDRQHKYIQNFFIALFCVIVGVMVMAVIMLIYYILIYRLGFTEIWFFGAFLIKQGNWGVQKNIKFGAAGLDYLRHPYFESVPYPNILRSPTA